MNTVVRTDRAGTFCRAAPPAKTCAGQTAGDRTARPGVTLRPPMIVSLRFITPIKSPPLETEDTFGLTVRMTMADFCEYIKSIFRVISQMFHRDVPMGLNIPRSFVNYAEEGSNITYRASINSDSTWNPIGEIGILGECLSLRAGQAALKDITHSSLEVSLREMLRSCPVPGGYMLSLLEEIADLT